MSEDDVSCVMAIVGIAVVVVLAATAVSWRPLARAARKRRQAHWVTRAPAVTDLTSSPP